MSKNRYVSDRFWSDTYVEELDPVEKLLFLYFITNDRTSLCGAYEISFRRVAMQTGIEQAMVERIVSRFHKEGKISYVDNHIIVWNFKKHQSMNPNMRAGAEREFNELPELVKETLTKGFESLPKDTLLYFTLPYSTLLNPSGTSANGSAVADGKGDETIARHERMRAMWREHAGTTLRNHVDENMRDFAWLEEELGNSLPDYLKAVRMIRADAYQSRSLQGRLMNYVGLRGCLDKVEAYMLAKTDGDLVNKPKMHVYE